MHKRIALALPALATLLVLGGCGDRIENTEMPLAQHPSVEINRHGMEGASQDTAQAKESRWGRVITLNDNG